MKINLISKAKTILFILIITFEIVNSLSSMYVPAINSDGKGMLTRIDAMVLPGKGDAYVSVEPLISTDIQNSEKIAFKLALNLANASRKDYDILFKIHAEAETVDGPSGGAAMAILAYAEIANKSLRKDLSITGSISEDGRIGKVGGIFEKAKALKEKGIKIFLIPFGQEEDGGKDIVKQAKEKWNMTIIGVKNIKEAISIAFTPEEQEITLPERKQIPSINLIEFQPSQRISGMKEIAESEKKELQNSLKLIKEKATQEEIAIIEKSINTTNYLLQKKYYYSSANNAFITRINIEAYLRINNSMQEFMKELKELKKELIKTKFKKETQENLEWITGAKLRYYWAKEKINEIEEKIGFVEEPAFLIRDLMTAKRWFEASKKINEVGKEEGKEAFGKNNLEKKAKSLINELEEMSLSKENEWNLKIAKKAFKEEEYVVSIYASLMALSYAEADSRIEKESVEKIQESLKNKFVYEGESIWGEIYYSHSIFDLQEWNRTEEGENLVNALKLQILSTTLETHLEDIKQQIEKPVEKKELTAEVKITSEKEEKEYNRILVLFGIIAIIFLVVIALFISWSKIKEKKSKKELTPQEKIDKLEELLIEGKISEKTFERLSKKYEKQKSKKQSFKQVK